MIPLGILASSQVVADSVEPLPGEFIRVQEWNIASGANMAAGPMVTPGNLAIARSVHRSGTGLAARIGDNGENTWHPIGRIDPELETDGYTGVSTGGSGDLYFWWCLIENPFDLVHVTVGPTVNRYLFITEWAGNATEDVLLGSNWKQNASQVGALPVADVQTSVSGALVTGALGAAVSNRTFDLLTPGYTADMEHRGSQMTLIAAANPNVPPGLHGPQWALGGSSASTAVATAAFRPK